MDNQLSVRIFFFKKKKAKTEGQNNLTAPVGWTAPSWTPMHTAAGTHSLPSRIQRIFPCPVPGCQTEPNHGKLVASVMKGPSLGSPVMTGETDGGAVSTLGKLPGSEGSTVVQSWEETRQSPSAESPESKN